MKNSFLRLFILFLIFLSNPNKVAAILFSDWSNTTADGTHFSYASGQGTTITPAHSKAITHVKSWYFYKNHIVGKSRNYPPKNNEYKFFVINEIDRTTKIFAEKEVWSLYLEEKNLIPFLWQRSFSENWSSMGIIYIFAVMLLPITVLLGLLQLFFLYKVFFGKKRNTTYRILASVLPLFLLLLFILGSFPQSI